MAYCTQCGAQLASDARFCSSCGVAISAPLVAGSSEASPSCPAESPHSLSWRIEVPVLGNRFLRGSILKGAWISALITGLIIGGIFALSGDLRNGAIAFVLAAAGTIGLFLCGLVGYLIIVGFAQPIAYSLDGEGIRMENVSRAAKGVHWAALILGILGRNPSAAGAGLLAKSSEARYCSWEEVQKVEDFPSERTLRVRGDLLTNIIVFCLPENYQLSLIHI